MARDSVTSSILGALRSGNFKDAIWIIQQGLLSNKATAALTLHILRNPGMVAELTASLIGYPSESNTGLIGCGFVATQTTKTLKQAGVTGARIYLMTAVDGGDIIMRGSKTRFEYHYLVTWGDAVIDSITGTTAESLRKWKLRFDPGRHWLGGSKPFEARYRLVDVTDRIERWDVKGLPFFSSPE